MFLLIENGDVYSPEPTGRASVLVGGGVVLKVGEIDAALLRSLDSELDVINADGCIVTPGFLDPHLHLLGGSGEKGFASQTPEISATEVIEAGVTTVVGCLGVDTTMKTLPGLLAKTKALKEEGLNAYMWSGGYNVPPTTITNSIGNDILFIEEVIGAGEIAISDERSGAPTVHEIARMAHDVHTSGMLSNKAGILHFHVGESDRRLEILRKAVEEHDVEAEWLYPTHINRTKELVLEAVELAKMGSFVDLDTVDEDLHEKLKIYLDNGGPPEKITASSDASITAPLNLFDQFRKCVVDHKLPLEIMLPIVTSNTAAALKLPHKGRVADGAAADLLVLEKRSLGLLEVISGGRRLFSNGSLSFKERFLDDSNRNITLIGKKESKSNRGKLAKGR